MGKRLFSILCVFAATVILVITPVSASYAASLQIAQRGNDELIWRDTLLVRQGEPVNIRSRYTLFTGEFVLHCHILDHEDLGMMKFVKIEE
ncbi:multicopper oxidase domain-containing protein [Cylindrospermum stagnale]|uniref:multicopper oxidase domain-containing protein n=1 Tax=Cylindrospermum stagnale TaxID=142864 RepID=UPI0002E68B0A|nr:multicopper oxidase domain-containing protein [Cylindrospermum stagnale]